jgi:DNA-binding IclR family transcriptional regulator
MAKKADDSEAEKSLSALFATLSHPMVRHIVELLAVAPRTAAELREHFDISLTMAKTAAETLRERGLATTSDDGKLYRLDDRALRIAVCWLSGILNFK